jgi:hypothetical protein
LVFQGIYILLALYDLPAVGKNYDFLSGCILVTNEHFDKPFFVLSSMESTYIDNFSALCQIVFSNINYKMGYFFTAKFLPIFVIKTAKMKKLNTL